MTAHPSTRGSHPPLKSAAEYEREIDRLARLEDRARAALGLIAGEVCTCLVAGADAGKASPSCGCCRPELVAKQALEDMGGAGVTA